MATSSKKSSTSTTVDKPVDKVIAKKTAPSKPTTAKKALVPSPAKVSTKPVSKPVSAPVTKAAAVKSVGAPKTKLKASSAPKPVLTTEQRNHYVSVAAFYIAERRGFTLGNPANDWLAAEAEVDRLIASGHFTV
jgi:hypothetical protein